MFFYEGQSRLAFFFANPNHEACFFTLLAFAFLALASFFDRQRGKKWIPLKIIGVSLSFASQFCLALTYSCGGYVAFGCTSLFAVYCVIANSRGNCHSKENPPKLRLPLLATLPVFFLILVIFVLPQGAKRLASISSFQKDLSIAHRLMLWKGGAAIVSQHWTKGLGTANAHPAWAYNTWLQPLETDDFYLAFVSDAMTTVVLHGLPAAGFLFSGLLWIFLGTFEVWENSGKREILWLICASMAYMICGLFNTCSHEAFLLDCFMALQAIMLAIMFLYHFWYKRLHLFKKACFAFSISACCCIGIYGAGRLFLRNMPYSVSPLPVSPLEKPRQLELTPRHPATARTLLFLAEDLQEHGRDLLLPIVSRGIHVKAFACDGGKDSLPKLASLFSSPNLLDNAFVVAYGANAANAAAYVLTRWHGKAKNVSAIYWDCDFNSPIFDSHPMIGNPNIPMLFFTDDICPIDRFGQAVGDCRYQPCDESVFLDSILTTAFEPHALEN